MSALSLATDCILETYNHEKGRDYRNVENSEFYFCAAEINQIFP